MKIKKIFIFLSIVISLFIFMQIGILAYSQYLISVQGGTAAVYDLGDGYRMYRWPGILYYPVPINIDGNYQSDPEKLVFNCYKLWSNDNWIIGKARGKDKTHDAYFAVKKKNDLPSIATVPDVLSNEYDKDFNNIYKHEIHFPINSVKELSQIIGLDVSKINLSTDKPGLVRKKGMAEDYEL